jgi:hypothetical protein
MNRAWRSTGRRIGAAAAASALALAQFALPAAAAETELGRLFFTPAQRQDMERKRHAPLPPPPAERSGTGAPPQESGLTLNGLVTRSSGRNTAWVNGVPENDRAQASAAGVRIGPPGEPGVQLRVGETYMTSSGTRRNLLPPEALSIRP